MLKKLNRLNIFYDINFKTESKHSALIWFGTYIVIFVLSGLLDLYIFNQLNIVGDNIIINFMTPTMIAFCLGLNFSRNYNSSNIYLDYLKVNRKIKTIYIYYILLILFCLDSILYFIIYRNLDYYFANLFLYTLASLALSLTIKGKFKKYLPIFLMKSSIVTLLFYYVFNLKLNSVITLIIFLIVFVLSIMVGIHSYHKLSKIKNYTKKD